MPDNFDRQRVSEYMKGLGGVMAAQRFYDCGESGRGWVGVCPNGHEVYHTFRCMLRVCPHCSAQASRKLAEKLTPAITQIVLESPARLGLKHITLTTSVSLLDFVQLDANGVINAARLDFLRSIIMMLRGAVVDMFKERFQDEKSENFCEGVGFAIGIEFGANLLLHFHVLALVPYWDYRDISASWYRFSFGRGRIVHVRAAGREVSDIEKSVGYVSKYVTKPLGRKNEDDTPTALRVADFVALHGQEAVMAALWCLFKGVRRFQTYAKFYDLKIPPDELEVCSECGLPLTWVPELEYLEPNGFYAFLNLLKTNKLLEMGGASPPKVHQLHFGGWLNRPEW